MSHLFVDINVLLDFIMRRPPFAVPAAELFQLAEEQQIWLYCSSLSFSQAHYILRKVVGSAKAQEILLDIAGLVTILTVDSRTVNDGLRSSFSDFEDALQYFAVIEESRPAIEAIITRDPKGFAAGTLPVLTPPQALVQLGS